MPLCSNITFVSQANNDLVSKLTKSNFTVQASQSFNDELTDQLEIIKSKDIRIILGNFNHTWARQVSRDTKEACPAATVATSLVHRHVFCKAYEEKMYGRKYQWLIAGVYPKNWWLDPEDAPCPVENLVAALKGTIVMETTSLATSNQPTALNIVRRHSSPCLDTHEYDQHFIPDF